jgi:hypothetical protein
MPTERIGSGNCDRPEDAGQSVASPTSDTSVEDLFSPDCVHDVTFTYLSRSPGQRHAQYRSTLRRADAEATNDRLRQKHRPPLYATREAAASFDYTLEDDQCASATNHSRVPKALLRILHFG